MPCWQWTSEKFYPRSFRNAWRGADAIIAMPGPSLKEAAPLLANAPRAGALVIGANTSFPAVRPDVWVGCDHPECYDQELMLQPFPKFMGNAYAEKPWQGRRIKEFPATYFMDKEKREGVDLPTNVFVPVRLGEQPAFVWGWTFFTALHLAAWFGCRRIYLAGVDLNIEAAAGGVKILDGAGFIGDGRDAAAKYADGRNLESRLAQINRTGMAIILEWLPRLAEMGRKHGYELIVTGETSAARKCLPFVPLAEALERIARRAAGKPMIAPKADGRVHGLLANQAQWGRPTEPFGVMTGTDKATEWRLPWWYENLRRFYSGPVMFADFGMSANALAWCKARGKITDCNGTYLPAWYNKPVAMTRSNFKRTAWIDTDAEVCGSLDALETMPLAPTGYAAAADGHNPADVGLHPVNTGVVVFEHGCPAIKQWARATLTDPSAARGDQEIINRMIDDNMVERPAELPTKFNRLRLAAPVADVRIVHWTGPNGDGTIRRGIFALKGRAGEIIRRITPSRPQRIAEIGVLDGRTSRLLLQRLPLAHVTMVDLWGELPNAGGGLDKAVSEQKGRALMAEALAVTEFAADRRTVIKCDSAEAAEQVEDNSLDLAFIDADHSEAGCRRDLEAWAPKVKTGGILCGHDIDDPQRPQWGVRAAVEDWMHNNGYEPGEMATGPNMTWWITKTEGRKTEGRRARGEERNGEEITEERRAKGEERKTEGRRAKGEERNGEEITEERRAKGEERNSEEGNSPETEIKNDTAEGIVPAAIEETVNV